jgi:hypothetical protein
MKLINRRAMLGGLAAVAAGRICINPLTQLLAGTDTKDPYADGKLIDGEPPKPDKGSFTIAVLPDTQYYSESYPETYLAQTRWIVENQKERNISCVLHLGDITNCNTTAEWENADKAMAQLDKAGIPYFLTTGNHDYSEDGSCKDRTTKLNDYFPAKRFKSKPTFGGTYDKEPKQMESSYHLFSAAGRDFLALCLEFGPRADVVRWANAVVEKYSSREVILVTHAYVFIDNTRYDWKQTTRRQGGNPHNYAMGKATDQDMCDGEELWQKLVSKHENFILTLNGHVLGDGLGRLTTPTPAGREIEQVLVNFQMRPKGGDGWLRLLEFKKDAETVEVYDYSPTRKQRNEGKKNRFTMKTAAVKKV